ncbi:MAG: ABC transporter permease [Spirochaetales bacterium]|nr:ABC transporter permease [Spirochaetales bacterium]
MKKLTFSRIIYWFTISFLFIPLIVLMVYSFNSSRSFTFTGFSLKWYFGLFAQWIDPEKLRSIFPGYSEKDITQIIIKSENIWRALGNSMMIALSTGAISTVIGTLGAIGLNWYKFSYKKLLQGISFVPLLLPEIITGVSLLIFFSSILKMELSLVTILLAHISFCLPFVILIVLSRLEEFDYTIIEAARDLGAREIEILLQVIIPVSLPGIFAGFLTAVTLSLEDFVVTMFVQGSNSTTLPLYIYSAVKRGVPPEVNALSVFIILSTVVLIFSVKNLIKYIVKS